MNPPAPEAEKAAREVTKRLVREGRMRRAEAARLLRDGLPIILNGFAVARINGRPEAAITAELEAAHAEAEHRFSTARTAFSRSLAEKDRTVADFAIAAWGGIRRDLANHLAAN